MIISENKLIKTSKKCSNDQERCHPPQENRLCFLLVFTDPKLIRHRPVDVIALILSATSKQDKNPQRKVKIDAGLLSTCKHR